MGWNSLPRNSFSELLHVESIIYLAPYSNQQAWYLESAVLNLLFHVDQVSSAKR